MEIIDPYDHVKGDYFYEYGYDIQWFEILTYHRTRFVLYGVGQWTNHLMDWAGCNFMHGRLPGSPVFKSVKDAEKWIKFQVKHKTYTEGMTLPGHHSGDHQCSKGCSDREVKTLLHLLSK